MKINKNILSLPPYVSTSWENITSLYKEDDYLILTLKNGSKIEIPDLNKQIIETIFDAHAQFLENSQKPKASVSFGFPEMAKGSLDSFTGAMSHNPEQKNAPDLPADVLKKIASVAKIFADESNVDMPKPEADCNCTHCQIAKAMQIANGAHPENLDEEVQDEELLFRLWDIQEDGEKLYTVINPLDKNEHYSVYLGNPIGCTCGVKNCEHIKAVLKN